MVVKNMFAADHIHKSDSNTKYVRIHSVF